MSPFERDDVVYVLLVVGPPWLIPFTRHWYVGTVPPFVAVAVNVTAVPEQTGFKLTLIVTPAVSTGFTLKAPETRLVTSDPQSL